jgi:hypothetical protein
MSPSTFFVVCDSDLTSRFSDYTGAQTKLPKILLNGNNICMVGNPILSLDDSKENRPLRPLHLAALCMTP